MGDGHAFGKDGLEGDFPGFVVVVGLNFIQEEKRFVGRWETSWSSSGVGAEPSEEED
jgi:hypothetical protein